MENGLGQLVDGVLGDEDFLNHDQQSSNKKWVGWMNDGNFSEPLEILFEFVDYNQISAILLHTSHVKTREVQVREKKLHRNKYRVSLYYVELFLCQLFL